MSVTDNDAAALSVEEIANPHVFAAINGWETLPLPYRGARIRFRTPSGHVVSYGVAADFARDAALAAWRCSVCGGADRPEDNRQRELRLDARYCSDACRQKAYRERRRA